VSRTTFIGGQEFAIDPYKEPLVQLKGAVKGYMRGTLPIAIADGKLPCAFCGSTFDVLGLHLRHTHDMSSRAYRQVTGLLLKTRLVSEPYRSRVLASITEERRLRMAQLGAGDHGQHSINRERKRKESLEAGYSPERLNKRGTCRDQIIAVSRRLAKENRGVLREADLLRQGIYGPSRRRWFPTMLALCTEVGATYAGKRDWTDVEMVRAFRELAERLGRTPTQKDLGGPAGTPSNSSYQERFGGLTEVSRRAGLPPNLPNPMTFGDEIDILNRYAVTGRIDRVARATHRYQPAIRQILGRYGVTPMAHEPAHSEGMARAAVIARRLADMPDEAMA
jgi:hypothetical protein